MKFKRNAELESTACVNLIEEAVTTLIGDCETQFELAKAFHAQRTTIAVVTTLLDYKDAYTLFDWLIAECRSFAAFDRVEIEELVHVIQNIAIVPSGATLLHALASTGPYEAADIYVGMLLACFVVMSVNAAPAAQAVAAKLTADSDGVISLAE